MFRDIAFMVNEKLCIIAGDNEIMCRIDPELHETCVCEKRLWSGCDDGKEIQRVRLH